MKLVKRVNSPGADQRWKPRYLPKYLVATPTIISCSVGSPTCIVFQACQGVDQRLVAKSNRFRRLGSQGDTFESELRQEQIHRD
jgi:hypothetical protein